MSFRTILDKDSSSDDYYDYYDTNTGKTKTARYIYLDDPAVANDEATDSNSLQHDKDGFFSDPVVLYTTIAIAVIILIVSIGIGVYCYYKKKANKLQTELENVTNAKDESEEQNDAEIVEMPTETEQETTTQVR